MSTKLGIIIADFSTQLAATMAVGATIGTLQSITDRDGNTIPDGRYFFTIDGPNSSKEFISCVITGTAITSIKTLSRQGVETAGTLRLHRIGAPVAITDFAHIKFINDLLLGTTNLNAATPLSYDGTASITTDNQLATKAYVDGVSTAGAPRASTTQLGISRLSVSANVTLGNPTITIATPAVITLANHGLITNDGVIFTSSGSLPTGIVSGVEYFVIAAGLGANTFEISATQGGSAINTSGSQSGTHTVVRTTPVVVGDRDPRLQGANYAPNNYGESSAGTDTYAITLTTAPTAYASGQVFFFKADVANVGACTFNVNALGAKNLKVNGNQTPQDGYIKAGALVQVQYDGTNMQILSVAGKPSVSQTGEEIYGASLAGIDTYAVTLVPAPVAYVAGMTIRFKADVANTGAASLDVNGLGPQAIKKNVSTALADNDIAVGQIIEVIYDGTNFQMKNPTSNSIVAGISAYKNFIYDTSADLPIGSGATTFTKTFTTGFPIKLVTVSGGEGAMGTNQNATSDGSWNAVDGNNCRGANTVTNNQIQAGKVFYLGTINNAYSISGVIQNVTATTFDLVITRDVGLQQYGALHIVAFG